MYCGEASKTLEIRCESAVSTWFYQFLGKYHPAKSQLSTYWVQAYIRLPNLSVTGKNIRENIEQNLEYLQSPMHKNFRSR